MNRTPTKDTAHTMPLLRINHLRAAAFAVATILGATGGAEAGLAEVKADVTYLASDETEGRGTGTKGEALAADYIIKQLEAIGAKPLPALGGWKQEFEFPSGIKPKPEGSSVTITIPGLGEQTLALNEGFYPLAFSDNGTTEGMVVFAGYGITTPESSDGFSYDSYGTLDVKDKVVLVLRYMPEKADADLRQKLARYSALRLKARAAREAGARAVLIVSGPNSDNAGQLIKTGFDSSDAGSSILGASITGAVAEAMFKAAKKDLRATQTAMDDGNPHAAIGFPLEGVHAKISIELEKEATKGYNVLAVLPATVPNPLPEYVAIGAHYDHLGRGESGGSLGRSGDAGKIHHGADDNASGTAATIEVGRILAAVSSERQRDTLLCFWSGEEIGLIGSAYFTRNMPLEGRGISCYINMDMVGRSKDDKLTVQGLGSSPDWAKVIEKANVITNLDLKLEDDPYQPTDSQSLYIAKVPAIELFTGLHLDYHRPSDTADKVNMEGVEKIARFAAAMALDAIRMEKPFEYKVYERRGRGMRGTGSGTMRVYTGVLPDYTATGDGMRLSGVVPGGPAEKAGLKEGDTIIEFGGAKVTSIYEYMYALDAAKPDKPIKVKVKRGSETIELDLTPKTRE